MVSTSVPIAINDSGKYIYLSLDNKLWELTKILGIFNLQVLFHEI